MNLTTVDYLIPDVRIRLGDLNPTTYRYLDSSIVASLLASIKTLQRWWNYKYLLDDSNNIYRNPALVYWSDFLFPELPVIQNVDETPIVIMATMILKEGSLENSSYSIGSWRDNEISASNIESGRIKDGGITRLWNELITYLTPPNKRLAWARKGQLPGFQRNPYEVDQSPSSKAGNPPVTGISPDSLAPNTPLDPSDLTRTK